MTKVSEAEALNPTPLRAFGGARAPLFAALALAVVFLWTRPADALPSFAGQTGAPCAACHVGGFGPQLTPFGIAFRANGYTFRGGTGPWSQIPVNLLVTPSYQKVATDLPAPPDGYTTTNNFFNILGSGSGLFIAGGYSFDGKLGVGGFEQVGFLATPGGALIASEATSHLEISKPFTLGNHSLLLGFNVTNTPSGADPYNSLYNGFQFPYLTPFITFTPAASPVISALGTTVYGLSLSALYDNSLYAEAGLYQTFSTALLSTMNIAPSSLGNIAGSAPYFRIANQRSWGTNFLQVGAVLFDVPLRDVPGALSASDQNEYVDWGFDATYQRTFGENILAVTSNILFESQTLTASAAAGLSANPTNYLTHFRVAASYYWPHYGFTLAYASITGSTDSTLFAPAPLTGSANGSPNSQTLVAQVDWTPFGSSTKDPGYPWLNVRVGLQYIHYLQLNGGTTNYDGFGRNAGDNNTLLLFTWWAF